ncbi:extracellular solute-binding protein [Pseudaeromonas paramecii]|uniref:Putrescine-binding periplasmic protein n=1 Tax=Pseudaeromonas paramecii TaxID=2138166 RepID=A0ABP8Q9G2_9GAMM
MDKRLALPAFGLIGLLFSSATLASDDKVLHVYNWSDYIAEDTVSGFEKETGIRVIYDVFDSNEVLEAKLLAGNTGFDLVVPSSDYLGRQLQAGVFMPLDKSKLPNLKNMDPAIMQMLQEKDPDNAHAVPYLGGSTGIGYNVDKVAAVMGPDFQMNTWEAIFNPDNLAKLHQCGVAFLNSPTDLFTVALRYMGRDPNSTNAQDYKDASAMMSKLRPYITYFNSSQYINDLANGDICVAVGWSGDIIQASDRAEEAGNGVHVEYVVPKEGSDVFYDMLTIPSDAKHPEYALAFINYLMRPEVIAKITNYVSYANANLAANGLVDEAIRDNPNVYFSDELKPKMFAQQVMPQKITRVITREWTKIMTGK